MADRDLLKVLRSNVRAAREAHERAVNAGFDINVMRDVGAEAYDEGVARAKAALKAAEAELAVHRRRVGGRKSPAAVKLKSTKGGPKIASPVGVRIGHRKRRR